MPSTSNNHFWVSIPNLEQRSHLPSKSSFIAYVICDLDIGFFIAFDGYKVDFFFTPNFSIFVKNSECS